MPDRALQFWERFHPAIMGAAACCLMLWAGRDLAVKSVEHDWNMPALYAAILGIASTFTAFLFTFYSFVATTDRGFIGRAKTTTYYRLTIGYTMSALILGTLLCVCTLPILVEEPGLATPIDRAVVAAWAGLGVWTTAAFVRAAYLFTIFAQSQKA